VNLTLSILMGGRPENKRTGQSSRGRNPVEAADRMDGLDQAVDSSQLRTRLQAEKGRKTRTFSPIDVRNDGAPSVRWSCTETS
jgi:hypothetical protein